MQARTHLGLSSDQPIVLFLASGGIHDHRKGWDLLLQALQSKEIDGSITVVIVGPKPDLGEQKKLESETQHSFVYFGEAHGDDQLAELYSAADITAVPSREDNMPLTAMESQSCGTPVVAFDIGGLSDIVRHMSSGYLASPGDTEGLAKGINLVLQGNLRDATRDHALKTWSATQIVPQLLDIYREVLSHAS
jgi:glycosyltransferase involved in cell wall biosynthesis